MNKVQILERKAYIDGNIACIETYKKALENERLTEEEQIEIYKKIIHSINCIRNEKRIIKDLEQEIKVEITIGA